MSAPTTTRALDRLEQLDAAATGSSAPSDPPRVGSLGLQMLSALVVPGLAAVRRHVMVGVLLLLAGVVGPIALAAWIFVNRDDLVGFVLADGFLNAVIAVGVVAVIARLAAIAEVAHAHRRTRGVGGWTTAATAAALVLALPVVWGVVRVNDVKGIVDDVFAGGSSESLFVPAGTAESGVDPEAITNILLLGGDAGPGRWGLRTDTMILVSVHEASGRTALVSIPRNLTRLQFAPGTPLAAQYANGFDDLANAVFPRVSTDEELMAHYSRDGLQGEAVALSEAIGYSLDVEVDDYALVNMQGFLEVIDALGGVTLELDQRVPLPPSIPGGKHPIPDSVGPGVVDMDGTLAIAYARSRSADSDYQRMQRQRQLLAALGSQVSASDALAGFSSVTGVLDDSMRTSLSAGEFSSLLDRLGDNSAIGESVGLAPPLIQPGSPDYDQIRAILDAVERYVLTGEPSGFAS